MPRLPVRGYRRVGIAVERLHIGGRLWGRSSLQLLAYRRSSKNRCCRERISWCRRHRRISVGSFRHVESHLFEIRDAQVYLVPLVGGEGNRFFCVSSVVPSAFSLSDEH